MVYNVEELINSLNYRTGVSSSSPPLFRASHLLVLYNLELSISTLPLYNLPPRPSLIAPLKPKQPQASRS